MKLMENFIIENRTHGDPKTGYLSFFEAEKDIPFPIKRIYYTYEVPVNERRGMHAHKTLQQVLWCPYGAIEIVLDNGQERTTYQLDSPNKALLVLKGYWRELVWKKEGSVLCVAASDYFKEADYIHHYADFLKLVETGYWND